MTERDNKYAAIAGALLSNAPRHHVALTGPRNIIMRRRMNIADQVGSGRDVITAASGVNTSRNEVARNASMVAAVMNTSTKTIEQDAALRKMNAPKHWSHMVPMVHPNVPGSDIQLVSISN